MRDSKLIFSPPLNHIIQAARSLNCCQHSSVIIVSLSAQLSVLVRVNRGRKRILSMMGVRTDHRFGKTEIGNDMHHRRMASYAMGVVIGMTTLERPVWKGGRDSYPFTITQSHPINWNWKSFTWRRTLYICMGLGADSAYYEIREGTI